MKFLGIELETTVLKIKNSAGTFLNTVANATTAARTWTFPDKDGIVAMLSDIQGSPETTEYKFDSSTANADPGYGDFRLNNATRAGTTTIYLSKTTSFGTDISNYANLLAIGDTIFIQDKSDSTSHVRYKISGTVTLNGNYYQIPVTVDAAPVGAELANNAVTMLVFRIAALGSGTGAVSTDIKGECDFRLTLTSGTPVTTADVTAATTIYCTPYKGNSIALYNGTNWNVRQSAEFSIALGTLTNDQAYDVFCYDNAGVPTIELLAWTNNTTRATGLAYQDGIYVKSGAATRRYLGSFLTTSTTTTESSASKRCLYNYYNQVEGTLKKYDASNYAYTSTTRRQANGSTANQVLVFKGINDSPVQLMASVGFATSSSVTIITVSVSIGLDSTTTVATDCLASFAWVTSTSSAGMKSLFNGYVGAGKHVLVWQEYGGTGVTFQGTTVGITSSGLLGSTYC